MEIYILDSLLRRTEVVDKFDSLIWTERYQDVGDFELVLRSTREARGQFLPGTLIACNTSRRVMMVETPQNKIDSDGKQILTVKGRSLELLLEDRIARYSMKNLVDEPTWNITAPPADVIRTVFDRVVRAGALSLADKIPFLMPGSIMATGSIPEPSTQIKVSLDPQTVLGVAKEYSEKYDLGFRLLRNFDMSELYFDIYSGHDRTTRQSAVEPVIFALDYDNLQDMTEFSTIEKTKNVAYVVSDFGSREVYGDNVDPDVDGFERRVLLVTASGIDENTVDVQDALRQEGLAALRSTRTYAALEGELTRGSPYKYGTHYELGDLVEMRNQDGEITYKRVTEQIFVSDAEGERAYPTLSINMFISQNTWLSQKTEKVWSDYGLTEYWNSM